MYNYTCESCKPDCFGNCPCDYGFPCPSCPLLKAGEEEKEEG